MSDWADERARGVYADLFASASGPVDQRSDENAISDALREAHARGRREGLEEAAGVCEARSDRAEVRARSAPEWADIMAACDGCADDIRALIGKEET